MIIDCYTNLGPGIANHRTQLQEPLEDTTSAKGLLASMDRMGTNRAVTFAPRWVGGDFVDPTYEKANAFVHEAVKAHPDRLIGYARVNPNYGKDAAAQLEKCLSVYKFKGLKLDPEWENFYPGDHVLAYPLYELAKKYKVPVLFHSWYSPSQPALFWQVANDFPDVPIIIAHLGGRLFADVNIVAQRAPNIFLDTSDHMYGPVNLVQSLGAERILYGTNTPFSGPEVELFKIRGEKELSASQQDLILGKNAARLHGLS